MGVPLMNEKVAKRFWGCFGILVLLLVLVVPAVVAFFSL